MATRREAQHAPQAAPAGGNRQHWLVQGDHGPYSQGVFSVSVDALTEAEARKRFRGLEVLPLDLDQARFNILNTRLSGVEEGIPEERDLYT